MLEVLKTGTSKEATRDLVVHMIPVSRSVQDLCAFEIFDYGGMCDGYRYIIIVY